MSDPRRSSTVVPATLLVAAPLVRLLAATVDVLADAYDPLAGEDALRRATASAAAALRGLVEDAPEATERALAELAHVAAALPPPASPSPAPQDAAAPA